MFNEYDESQRLTRNKYGHQAFVLTIILFFIHLLLGFQWGETTDIETILLLLITSTYFIVMNVYHGAHYSKKDNLKWGNILFLFLGGLNVSRAFTEYNGFINNGKVSQGAVTLAIGIVFLSIPITCFFKETKRKIKK